MRVLSDEIDVGIVTDLGVWDESIVDALLGVRTLLIEANYDEDALWTGPYPTRLKYRVAGRRGHLSNLQARFLVERLVGPRLEHVALGHLSDTNNSDERALETVRPALAFTTTQLSCAQQHMPTVLWSDRENRSENLSII